MTSLAMMSSYAHPKKGEIEAELFHLTTCLGFMISLLVMSVGDRFYVSRNGGTGKGSGFTQRVGIARPGLGLHR